MKKLPLRTSKHVLVKDGRRYHLEDFQFDDGVLVNTPQCISSEGKTLHEARAECVYWQNALRKARTSHIIDFRFDPNDRERIQKKYNPKPGDISFRLESFTWPASMTFGAFWRQMTRGLALTSHDHTTSLKQRIANIPKNNYHQDDTDFQIFIARMEALRHKTLEENGFSEEESLS